jgi:TetR/AcrR family transcriptional regulator, cholesterol catabolism regulator
METRERILQEASAQFMKYGIRSITMDDIAQNLSISKRTIYENFKDKNELLKSCMEKLLVEQRQSHENTISSTSNVIEAMFCFMQEGVKAIRTINPLFVQDLRKYHLGIWEDIQKNKEDVHFSQIYRLLRKGINENLFRKDINVEIVAKILMEQLNMLSDEEAFPREKYQLEEVLENIITNFMRGIATRKGLDYIDNHRV